MYHLSYISLHISISYLIPIGDICMARHIWLFYVVIVISFSESISLMLQNEYHLITRYLLCFYIVMQAKCLYILLKIIIKKIFNSDIQEVEKLLREHCGSKESNKLYPHAQEVATFFRTKSNTDTYYYVKDIGIVYYVKTDGTLYPVIDFVSGKVAKLQN